MPPYWVLEQQSQLGGKNQDDDGATKSTEIDEKSAGGDDANGTRVEELPQKQQLAAVAEDSVATDSSTVATSVETGDLSTQSSNDGRTVHFNLGQNVTHKVTGRHEFSADDYERTWFLPKDFERVNSWNRMTVKLFRQMAKNGQADYDELEHCIRGLEHRLKGQNFQRTTIKTNAIYSVLMEQSRQRKTPVDNGPERIMNVYKLHTVCCVTQAQEKGQQDEKDAAAAFAAVEPDQKCHRSSKRRSSAMVFDEDDLKELRDLDEEDEAVPDDSQAPATTAERYGRSRSNGNYKDQDGEKDGSKTKKKGFSRFSKFFHGKKKKGGTGDEAMEETGVVSTVDPPAPRRRMYRRSSM